MAGSTFSWVVEWQFITFAEFGVGRSRSQESDSMNPVGIHVASIGTTERLRPGADDQQPRPAAVCDCLSFSDFLKRSGFKTTKPNRLTMLIHIGPQTNQTMRKAVRITLSCGT